MSHRLQSCNASETPKMATTRKRKATQKDKDETPVKRAKTEDETPTERAKTGDRTPTESANSEDETPTKHVKNENDTPAKRAPAPRSAKAKRNDPEWLVTNEKSPLAIEDLHVSVLYRILAFHSLGLTNYLQIGLDSELLSNQKFQAELCNPKTYEGFTKEDWEDLRSTLPDNVPLNPDGYSISTHFLKYDPDFRRGIREFQEDLASGRLEPAWLEEAAEAMEERANGEFDDFKEKNYEEFWGQKQKLAWGTLAGESTTLKLEVMIEHDVFRVGDEIVFVRAIGRGEKRVLLEKECKVNCLRCEPCGRPLLTGLRSPVLRRKK